MNRIVPSWLPPVLLVVLVALTFLVLPPRVSSDSTTYLEAMSVVITGHAPEGFRPNRILTTIGGLEMITFGGLFTGSILSSWYTVNALFYFFGMWIFYLFLRRFLRDETGWVSLLGMLMLATNYTTISFGLNYLLDIGGWFFYIAALYFAYRFMESGRRDYLYWAAFLTGFGGLFKEYALCAAIPVVLSLIYREYKHPKTFWKRLLMTAILGVLPLALFYTWVYQSYGYTYADWFSFNEARYGLSYGSRALEYIKVFGSLFTFLWFLIIPGLYLVLNRGRALFSSQRLMFLGGVFLSALPVFFWPAITQRVYFIPVIFGALLASLFLKHEERRLWFYVPVVLLYAIAGFTMDHYILPAVNIDAFLHL